MDCITSTIYYKFVRDNIHFYNKKIKSNCRTISERDFKNLLDMPGFKDFCDKLKMRPLVQIVFQGDAQGMADFLQKKNEIPNCIVTTFKNHFKVNLIFLFVGLDVEFTAKDNFHWGKNMKI
jgi:hypothetical protein